MHLALPCSRLKSDALKTPNLKEGRKEKRVGVVVRNFAYLFSAVKERTRGSFRQISTGFLIAMDDSDWAIHDSFLAARWRMLADFD